MTRPAAGGRQCGEHEQGGAPHRGLYSSSSPCTRPARSRPPTTSRRPPTATALRSESATGSRPARRTPPVRGSIAQIVPPLARDAVAAAAEHEQRPAEHGAGRVRERAREAGDPAPAAGRRVEAQDVGARVDAVRAAGDEQAAAVRRGDRVAQGVRQPPGDARRAPGEKGEHGALRRGAGVAADDEDRPADTHRLEVRRGGRQAPNRARGAVAPQRHDGVGRARRGAAAEHVDAPAERRGAGVVDGGGQRAGGPGSAGRDAHHSGRRAVARVEPPERERLTPANRQRRQLDRRGQRPHAHQPQPARAVGTVDGRSGRCRWRRSVSAATARCRQRRRQQEDGKEGSTHGGSPWQPPLSRP